VSDAQYEEIGEGILTGFGFDVRCIHLDSHRVRVGAQNALRQNIAIRILESEKLAMTGRELVQPSCTHYQDGKG
jgi:hypothetical protein